MRTALVWLWVAVVEAMVVGGLVLALANGEIFQRLVATMAFSVTGALLAPLGALVITRQRGNLIGWLLLACGGLGLYGFARGYSVYAMVTAPGSLPAGPVAAAINAWGWVMPLLAVVLLLQLFPTGRLPSPRWRPASIASTALLLAAAAIDGLSAQAAAATNLPLPNPLMRISGVREFNTTFYLVWVVVIPAVFILSALSLVVRYRRASGVERAQLRWLIYAACFIGIGFGASFFLMRTVTGPASMIVAFVAFLIPQSLPIAIGVALFRYRLYDIDVIISRTLVYSAITALLAGLYVATVALFQRITGMEERGADLSAVPLIFVLVAVASFLKDHLQALVGRRLQPQRAAGLDHLRALAQLHEAGVLTDAEYAAKTKDVLAGRRVGSG